MYWVTYEKRASVISHAPYPEIFTHARRRRRHDARWGKSIDFSASLRNANKSSDKAARGLGQVSAGFPSVKDLGYVEDVTVLSVISLF